MSIEKESNSRAFFTRWYVVFFGAMISCALWGSAFPAVKIGMQVFQISSSDTANQFLFAGLRFALAGFLVILIGSALRKKPLIPSKGDGIRILLQACFQTVGQYAFYYVGIAHATGGTTAIVNSSSNFLAILISAFVFRMEKLDLRKILGCALGFVGILFIYMGPEGLNLHMTILGEGMILISAISSSFSSSVGKKSSQKTDPVVLSGYQFMVGGFVLAMMGICLGGSVKIETLRPSTVVLYIYLALISTVAYTIWTILLKYNPVSKVAIFGFMNPVFGVLLSAIFLGEGENLGLNYLLALLSVSIGIFIVNHRK